MKRVIAGPKSKSVGIWIRVSTEDQARGESPEHHEKRARLYAEAKGWEVREVYRLEGVSGKAVLEHPEAKRMLTDVRSGHISALIFSKLARLARNTKELLEFSEIFREHHADLVSLQESIDTSTPAGRLMYVVIGALASWEREEIAERVAVSIPIRAKLGKPLGGASPFGYRWVDRKFVPDPEEAPIRKLLYELFLEHRRKKTVARILNERGYRTRNGSKWSDTTVDRLIRDPTAKGLRRANYTKSTGGKKAWLLKPESDWVYHDIEAIVPEQLWAECNAILDSQRNSRRKVSRQTVHLFAGYAHCSCGQKMYVPSNTPKYVCYKCRNKIPIVDLEGVYHEQLRSFLVSPEEIGKHLEKANASIREKEELLSVLETERKKLGLKVDKLYELYQDGQIKRAEFGNRHRPLDDRLKAIEDETPKLQAELDVMRIGQLSSEEVISEARDLHERWPQLTPEEKRRIIETITETVIVSKDEVEINLLYLPHFLNDGSKATHPQNRVAFLPFVRVCLKTKIPKGYPENPSTLGEHLLCRRMKLGLRQKDVGKLFGVDAFTILNWEKDKTIPATRYLPRIASFLGYDPFPTPRTLGERIVAARRRLGIPRKRLARRLGVDEGALKRWEEERVKPQGRCLAKLAQFLADAGSAPGTRCSP